MSVFRPIVDWVLQFAVVCLMLSWLIKAASSEPHVRTRLAAIGIAVMSFALLTVTEFTLAVLRTLSHWSLGGGVLAAVRLTSVAAVVFGSLRFGYGMGALRSMSVALGVSAVLTCLRTLVSYLPLLLLRR